MKQVKVFHPQWESSVFNKAISEKFAKQGYDIAIYSGSDFNVVKEQAVLAKCLEIIFVFPMWWYNPPWNFKKWMDEVITYGLDLSHIKFSFSITVGGKERRFIKPHATIDELYLWAIKTLIFCKATYLGSIAQYEAIIKKEL